MPVTVKQMETDVDKRKYTYDNLKFLLIVLVVLGHCIGISSYTKTVESFKSAFCFIYFLHMPGFIFTAGLFCKNTVRSRKRTQEKVLYYLALYVLLQAYITLVRYYFFRSLSFSLFKVDGLPWFMLVMAFFYGLTYILRRFDKRFILFLAILTACLAGYDDGIGSFLAVSRTIVYYPLFFLGYMLDPEWLLAKTRHIACRVTGLLSLAFFAWLCLFRLELVWMVKPLFSGKNPFSALPFPVWGSVWRLIYYVVIFYYLLCLLAVSPEKKNIFTVVGQRTLQIYFFHFSLIYVLETSHLCEALRDILPGGVWQLSFIGMALIIVLIFSLPFWAIPFDYIRKKCRME